MAILPAIGRKLGAPWSLAWAAGGAANTVAIFLAFGVLITSDPGGYEGLPQSLFLLGYSIVLSLTGTTAAVFVLSRVEARRERNAWGALTENRSAAAKTARLRRLRGVSRRGRRR